MIVTSIVISILYLYRRTHDTIHGLLMPQPPFPLVSLFIKVGGVSPLFNNPYPSFNLYYLSPGGVFNYLCGLVILA